MNDVNLIGNLGRDVQVRELAGGKAIGKTLLAVSRMRQGQRAGTDWIPITLWDRQATNAAKYLGKGSRVAVQGRLHGDYVPVKGAEGEQRRTRLVLEVIVDRITYLSAPRQAGGGETNAEDGQDAGEEKPAGGRSSK